MRSLTYYRNLLGHSEIDEPVDDEMIRDLCTRILKIVYLHLFRKFRAPKFDVSEQAFPLYDAIAYTESIHIKMCKFIMERIAIGKENKSL